MLFGHPPPFEHLSYVCRTSDYTSWGLGRKETMNSIWVTEDSVIGGVLTKVEEGQGVSTGERAVPRG